MKYNKIDYELEANKYTVKKLKYACKFLFDSQIIYKGIKEINLCIKN